jgi:Lipid A 3-O-deacylase (PagL)
MLAAACLAGSCFAHSQEPDNLALPSAPSAAERIPATATPADAVIAPKPVSKPPVRSEIAIMGMVPDGDYRLFAATVRCTAWTVGVEYDRHSWGHFLRSDVDYVVEVMPVVVLSQPTVSDFWGNAVSSTQEHVPGLMISPFGFRFLWGKERPIRLYTVGKLGAIAFTTKAFSQNASYANFSVQAAFGVQIRLSERVDLRVEPFEFFHVSNGYLAASNPGMDQLGSRYGISYRLKGRVRAWR